jgi:hypothetical protein
MKRMLPWFGALGAVVVVIVLIVGVRWLGDLLFSPRQRENDKRFKTPHGSLKRITLITECAAGENHIAFAVMDPELLADVALQFNNVTHESGPRKPEAILGCAVFEFESGTMTAGLTVDWTTLPQPGGLHRINLKRVFEKLRRQFKEPKWFFREPPQLD